jgi:hypothetical protein
MTDNKEAQGMDKKNKLKPEHGAKLIVMQPKMVAGSQIKQRPVAPSTYRPQPLPKVLQTKSVAVQRAQPGTLPRTPAAPHIYLPETKKVVQPKTATQIPKPPDFPPVYRPQPTPKVLQTKKASSQGPRAGQLPRQTVASPHPAPVQAKLSGTIQAAFSVAGANARNRVNALTGGANHLDPFGGFTFAQWHPNGARIGFDNAIKADIIANAPHDNLGPPNWYTCPYCNFEYPINRMHVDHIVPWAAYSALMTTAPNINAARAWEVYVGCNDPANLRLACDSCNASKGQNVPTPVWIAGRRAQALLLGGF